ncbi:MAG TPA: hypothetical protein VEZ14_10890 [Dehalococcoidia bacterium]|nr:hypothetical protein [Dehalococcoidia bacterium]
MSSIARLPLRLPFTIVAILGLWLRAWRTDSASHDLPRRILQRVGFAPQDLVAFGWRRLITSALFTHGRWEFWIALVLIALAVGAAEWQTGTVRAFLTFWGVHLATLLGESLLIALPLKLAGVPVGAQLSDVRDVGPSAGYVGALGLVCALLPSPWRHRAAIAVLIGLLFFALLPPDGSESDAVKLSADIAHVIAFVLGWFSLTLWRHAGHAGGYFRKRMATTTSP